MYPTLFQCLDGNCFQQSRTIEGKICSASYSTGQQRANVDGIYGELDFEFLTRLLRCDISKACNSNRILTGIGKATPLRQISCDESSPCLKAYRHHAVYAF